MNSRPGRSLMLQDYEGEDIPNYIDIDPDDASIALARFGLDSILRARVQLLSPPTGRYNCHGLVFAARHTNIPPVAITIDIDDLLKRDQYERVAPPPRVGDIIVYRSQKGVIEHTGFVAQLDRISETVEQPSAIWIWSMWGGLGEYRHQEMHCPYSECAHEYWRLKR